MAGYARDRISQSVEHTGATVSRLLDGDKLIIDNPDIQMYLSQHACREECYFCRPEILEDALFYKAKSYVYRQLNVFDELLSISSRTSSGWYFLKPAALHELSDWEAYMREKLRHPLYRSILNREGKIFGASLRDFWEKNRREIQSTPPDPFIW